MPASSLIRLASQSFSIRSARSRAQVDAARGRPADAAGRRTRPRQVIRAGLGQHVRPLHSPASGAASGRWPRLTP